jgi:hypothetical protein
MAGGQEMSYGRSILEDLRLAEEAGMVFREAAEEVEAEVDELEALDTAQLCVACPSEQQSLTAIESQ